MLRSVYLKTLRDMRWGILGWGGGLGLLVIVTAYGWATAYADAPSRLQFATQVEGALSVAQAIYGPPRSIETLGGFIEWRVLGLAPVLLGLYLILAATSMTRGAEEARTIETVAATPCTRRRVLGEQAGGLVTGLVVAAVLAGLFTAASGAAAGEATPALSRVCRAILNLGLAASLFGACGLLAGQLLIRRRTAALAAAGAMAAMHLVNTVPLVEPGLRVARYASPMYLYSRSSPLSNGHMDWPAASALLVLAAGVTALAMLASGKRDLFDVWRLRDPAAGHEAQPAHSGGGGPAARQWALRSALGRGLGDTLGPTVGWAIALTLLAALVTAILPNIREALLEQPDGELLRRLKSAGLTSERGMLSALLFSLLPPLVTVFSVMLAASWAGEELSQRLELEVALPVARWWMFLQRTAAAVIGLGLALFSVATGMIVTIELGHIDVPIAAVATASAALLVLAGTVLAAGFATASWRPALTTPIAGVFVAVSYFANLVIPLLGLPSWARYVSVFGLFGSPLADGAAPWRLGVLAGLAVALTAAGAVGFQRKDIAR